MVIILWLNLEKQMLLGERMHYLVAISGPAGIYFVYLTFFFYFEWIAALVVAALQRFVEAICAAGHPPLAAKPVCRLWA